MSLGDLTALITAITSGVVAILGAIGALILQLRRISPKERHDAADQASSTDEAQDEQLRILQEKLARLERQRGEEPSS